MGTGINNNYVWSSTLARELDAMDGKRDGAISAKNWNSFLDKMNSKGNIL